MQDVYWLSAYICMRPSYCHEQASDLVNNDEAHIICSNEINVIKAALCQDSKAKNRACTIQCDQYLVRVSGVRILRL